MSRKAGQSRHALPPTPGLLSAISGHPQMSALVRSRTQPRLLARWPSNVTSPSMSAGCCHTDDPHRGNENYRRVLWAVLGIKPAMFAVEVAAGVAAGSASLQADALDFLGGDAETTPSPFCSWYGASLSSHGRLCQRRDHGRARLVGVLGIPAWHVWHETLPSAVTMGAVGVAACIANAASFGLLWAYRGGDANMRSAWVCTRNDVLGNPAVLLAALGVFGTGTGWPDVIVASIMAGLALQGAWIVLQQSLQELRIAPSPV